MKETINMHSNFEIVVIYIQYNVVKFHYFIQKIDIFIQYNIFYIHLGY